MTDKQNVRVKLVVPLPGGGIMDINTIGMSPVDIEYVLAGFRMAAERWDMKMPRVVALREDDVTGDYV